MHSPPDRPGAKLASPPTLLQPSPSTWSDSGLSIDLDNLMGGGHKTASAAPPKKTMNQLAATVSAALLCLQSCLCVFIMHSLHTFQSCILPAMFASMEAERFAGL